MSTHDGGFGGGYTIQFGNAPEGGVDGSGAHEPPVTKDVTTASFSTDVIEGSRQQPVLVDFWAPWCGPCKQLAPALEKVVHESQGKVKLVKMNIDEHPAIAGQLGIQSIPAVIAFSGGQPVDGFMGAIPESKIREFVERVGGDGGAAEATAETLAAAQDLADGGDLQGASQVYAAVLQQEPENLRAIAGLAGVLMDAGDLDMAREVLMRVPEGKDDAPELAAAKARVALADQMAELPDSGDLEARVTANPMDHQARFDLALLLNARNEREAAADNLLAIMRADRTWQDDGARLQLLKFFEAWGTTDPATLSARRKLSSLLFS